jgi:hypothetical protein
VFVGATTTITTTAGQRLVGSAEAPLRANSGIAANVQVGLGYQPVGGGTITNFVGSNYSLVEVSNTNRQTYAASGSVVPGAGTWTVGYIVLNPSTFAIDNNDFSNGWIMVVNP